MIAIQIITRASFVQAAEQSLNYFIERDGDTIGTHRVTHNKTRSQTRVSIHTDIHIQRFFFTQYAYSFSSVKDWQGGGQIG